MNWNKWVRQTHRWLSIASTVGVIVNIFAVALKGCTLILVSRRWPSLWLASLSPQTAAEFYRRQSNPNLDKSEED